MLYEAKNTKRGGSISDAVHRLTFKAEREDDASALRALWDAFHNHRSKLYDFLRTIDAKEAKRRKAVTK